MKFLDADVLAGNLDKLAERLKAEAIDVIDRKLAEAKRALVDQEKILAELPKDLPSLLQAAPVVVMGTVEFSKWQPSCVEAPWEVRLRDGHSGLEHLVRAVSPYTSGQSPPATAPRLKPGTYRMITLLLPVDVEESSES